jgi:hypothetical protein
VGLRSLLPPKDNIAEQCLHSLSLTGIVEVEMTEP